MKLLSVTVLCLLSWASFCQSAPEAEVKATIQQFFEGFHQQDSMLILSAVSKEIKMQSVGKQQDGSFGLATTDFDTFLKSILVIPATQSFEEKILSYNIQVDGNMAHAWTPYQFWFGGSLHHCGVNSFQLYRTNDLPDGKAGTWQIIYVVDTRHNDCE